MTNSPKASITRPAASVPSCPSLSTIRVEATLRASLKTVAIRSTDGKLEKSSGRYVLMATIKMRSDSKIFETKKTSSKIAGNGNTIMAINARIPSGNVVLVRKDDVLSNPKRRSVISMTVFSCLACQFLE